MLDVECVTCDRCGSDGQVRGDDPEGMKWIDCPECDGTGWVALDHIYAEDDDATAT
jgi:DnaJ-class molecular chaperone